MANGLKEDRLKTQIKDLILNKKLSVRKAALELKIPKSSLHNLIKGYGLKLPKRGRPKGSSILNILVKDGVDIKQIIKDSGNNVERAAFRIGVCANTLRRFMRENKIK